MTDRELVAKKLAFIETCLRDLRVHADPGAMKTDIKEERFVERTLQLAIQAALDTASHIVSDERLGEPSTNRELFETLVRAGWMDAELGSRVSYMAGFGYVLVHGYTEIDVEIIEDILANRLGDVDAFVQAIRSNLSRRGE